MSQRPVRVGLIGLGAIGHRVARNMAKGPLMQLSVVCDLNAELADVLRAALAGRWVEVAGQSSSAHL
jgi:predicted homoserine dehydrogenase-like protein